MIHAKRPGFHALLRTTALVAILVATNAHAQVTTDGSVGAVTTQNGTTIDIPQSLGKTNASDTTVLHSFSQFDIANGQTVTFDGDASLTAIIARITGGSASSIDGTITSTAPNAALFLLNPQGFVFGPDATLNLPAGFYLATPDKVNFGDGTSIDMTATPVGTLSTSPVASFGFLGSAAGSITWTGSHSATNTYQSVAGDLDILAANVTIGDVGMLIGNPDPAIRNQIRIGSVGNAIGTVGLNGDIGLSGGSLTIDRLQMLHQTGAQGTSVNDEVFSGSNVTFTGDSLNVYSDETNGRTDTIAVKADSLALSNGSMVDWATNAPSATTARPQLSLNVTGAITMTTFKSYLGSWDAPGAIVTIKADSMSMTDSSLDLWAGAFDGGQLTLTTAHDLNLNNSVIRATQVGSSPLFSYGTSYDPTHPGNAGTLNLTVGGILSLNNGSSLAAASQTTDGTAGGAAGTVTIHAATFDSTDSDIDVSAQSGQRAGGTIAITTTGNATLTGTANSLGTLDADSGDGSGGTITLTAGGALASQGSTYTVIGDASQATTGAPTAGAIALKAATLISIGDAFNIYGHGSAAGGSLTVTTTGKAAFTTPAINGNSDTAAGGTVTMMTGGDLTFTGTAVNSPGFLQVDSHGPTPAGHMSFTTGGAFTTSDMYFSQSGAGTSNHGGDFTVDSAGNIVMGYTYVLTGSNGGVGANTRLNGQDITLTGSYLYASGPQGQSGDIAVVGRNVLLDSTWIYDQSINGIGGNILVKADAFTMVGNAPSITQASQGTAFDPNNVLLFGVSYDSGAYLETSGLNDTGSILVEARTFTIGNNALIMGANPDYTLDANSGEYVFSGWGPSSANVTVHANTIVINPGATIFTAADTASRAGALTIGASDLTMNGGTIETIGGSGGIVRIGADTTLTLNAGAIHSDITAAAAGSQDGDIFLGTRLSDPVVTNAACAADCLAFQPFSTPWVPGTHFGVPATYRNQAVAVTALGQGALIVGQSDGIEPDNVVFPDRDPLQVQAIALPGGAFAIGPYVYTADSHSPSSVCAAADASSQGKSTMANLLMRIPDQASGGLGPETYGLPEAAPTLSLNTPCLRALDLPLGAS